MAGRQQHPVLLAERDLELAQDAQQHVAAGLRAARLDEAQVARRDAGVERQVELASPPPLAPLPEHLTDLALHRRDSTPRRLYLGVIASLTAAMEHPGHEARRAGR